MSVNQRIRMGRLALGLSEQQFGDRVGVTRGAVQQWEKEGGTAPRRKNQKAVADLLGISVSELMNPDDAIEALKGEHKTIVSGDLSPAAFELARLFDMLPPDRVLRTIAYNEATTAILKALRQPGAAPSSAPIRAGQPKKRHA